MVSELIIVVFSFTLLDSADGSTALPSSMFKSVASFTMLNIEHTISTHKIAFATFIP
jgi:hypothetical protein